MIIRKKNEKQKLMIIKNSFFFKTQVVTLFKEF